MKIAYLAAANSIHTTRWVNAMSGLGHEIHLITMHYPDDGDCISRKVQIHALPFRTFLGYFLNKWRLKKMLNRIKPDILHAHYASGYGTLSRLSDFHPNILSVWGSDILVFPYESEWKKKLLIKNLSAADHITSTSRVMKKQVEKLIIPKHEVLVIPFGVDCEKFKPLEKINQNGEFAVGIMKTLEKVYGIDYLLSAFAAVKKKYPSLKLKLLIGGKGPLENQLKKLSRELGIGGQTEFLGFIPHDKVPEILNKFSVFVSPSNSESFGVAVIEASACGVPVVVSDVGGLPEVAKDGITGFIVPKGSVEAISEAIIKFIEDDKLRINMGLAGRDFVSENYDWNKNVAIMENLYEDIMNKNK